MTRPLLAVFGLALTACATGGPRLSVEDAGIDPPGTWAAADTQDGALVATWWASFDDPGLEVIVAEALARNHDLRAAAARVEAAAAEARIAGADLLPRVGVGLSGSRQKQNFIGFPDFTAGLPAVPGAPATESRAEPLSTTTNRFGLSLDTSWEADLWGRLRAGEAAAVSELLATRADYDAARLSLAGQTVKVWLAAVEAREQLELARRTVESYRETARQIRRRYERGILGPLDLRLALNARASAEANEATRLGQLDGAIRQLEILLGRYPSGRLDVTRILPAVPGPVPAGLPAELVGRRPDLVAAERRLEAAGSRVRQAQRSLYPRLTLTASGGTATEELGDLLDGDFSVWSLAAGLLQPIFQGGRLRAGVERGEAIERQALAAYAGAALGAYGEVETALAAESLLARSEDRLAESARQAGAARVLARDRYLSGLEPYITVLEAQRRQLSSESLLLTARRQRLENRVNLHLALGGDFPDPDTGSRVASLADPTTGGPDAGGREP